MGREAGCAHLGEELVEARLGGRDVVREQLEPRRGREPVGDDEGAQVQELGRHDRGFLCRNDYPGGEMPLLTDDGKQ